MRSLISFLIFLSVLFASRGDDFDRFQTNIFIKYDSQNTTIGHRWYPYLSSTFNQYTQTIIRHDFFDSPYRIEYRRVDKGTASEDWYRFQWKHFKLKNLWYNSRFEHRRRQQQKDNIFRYRPQFGIRGGTYLTFEPHFQYTYKTEEFKHSHTQIFIGHELFQKRGMKIIPFFEIDTDEDFNFDFIFLGVDIKWIVRS